MYRRILLKLSGEALKGKNNFGYDFIAIKQFVANIAIIKNKGVEIALVIGGGNIWRGNIGKAIGMNPVRADYMGMLATVMNALALKDAFFNVGIICEIHNAINMSPIVESFNKDKAIQSIEKGKIIIFACGIGHPFFTTDTTAALRALEIGAEIILKATKVDGVYTEDPIKNKTAKKYQSITFDEILYRHIKIMDSTAFSLCQLNNMPIIVFNFIKMNNLENLLSGKIEMGTLIFNSK